MKQILITILLTLAIPCASFAQQQVQQQGQQTSEIDKLIEGYQNNKRAPASRPMDPESEIRRLQSQLIDLRVERDRLAEEVLFLKEKIDTFSNQERASGCMQDCIPVAEVEEEKIITHVIYTVSQYRLAELITQTVPEEFVEVHNTAQKIMRGAINDLDTLGFDTSDMNTYPTLEDVLEQWNISQGSRSAR